MTNLRKSWKVIVLFALGTILTLGYVVRSRAFTLIESQSFVLPYIFNSSVSGQVKVSNISADKTLTVSIAIIEDTGTVFQQQTIPTRLLPGQTFTFPINRTAAGGALSLRPVVTVDGAENFSSALIGLLVFNNTGQIIAVLPAVQLPAGN